MFVTGLVLAAGGSRRLGAPKQLLAYGETTLLGASLQMARKCGFDELLVTLGGAAEEVRSKVDLSGAKVVDNDEFETGCSSSICAALEHVDDCADGLVILLGDQPEVSPASVRRLLEEAGGSPIGICRYDDGLGHPLFFHRRVFRELAMLHGDKGVWKLIESGHHAVTEVGVEGPTPLDVDTREDYMTLLDHAAATWERP